MAYTRHTWVDNETISKEKLNNIEDGIEEASQSNGAMYVHGSYVGGNYTLDKTIQELYDATQAGIPVYLVYQYGGWTDYVSENSLCRLWSVFKYDESVYRVGFLRTGGYENNYIPNLRAWIFGATSKSEYPTSLATKTITWS